MSDVQTTRKLLREALKRAVHVSSLSPAQIADELTKRGRPTTEAGIYAWLAETKQNWHIPADTVPDLCEILKDDTMQRLLLSKELSESLELGENLPRIMAILRGRTERPQKRQGPRR